MLIFIFFPSTLRPRRPRAAKCYLNNKTTPLSYTHNGLLATISSTFLNIARFIDI